MRARRDFYIFLLVHFVVWTLVPLMKGNLHPDALEAIDWGMLGGWVNDKHPPLSGFLANLFFQAFGRLDMGIYVLSQLCMLATFAYVYKLAKLLLDDEAKAAASAMLLEGVVYYAMTASDQYNCNIVSVPLWAAAAYYFYRATHTSSVIPAPTSLRRGTEPESSAKTCRTAAALRDWLLLGLAAGLAALDKYSCVFLFVPMAAYMLASKGARKRLAQPGPYLCAAIALALFAPHAYWMYRTDFASLQYMMQVEYNSSYGAWTRIVEPLRFVAGQLASCLGAITIYTVARSRTKEAKLERKARGDTLFLYMMAFGPFAALVLHSVATNTNLPTMWGIPLLFSAGIALFYFFPMRMTGRAFSVIRSGAYAMMAFFAAISIVRYARSDGHRIYFPREEFIARIYGEWNARAGGAPLSYVTGNIWYASVMSVYGAGNPRTILCVDRHYRRELTPAELAERGIAIFGSSEDEVRARQEELGLSLPVEKSSFEVRSPLGRTARYDFYYTMAPPEHGHD